MYTVPVQFSKVTRQKSKASILILGTSGSGKSTLALRLADALANGQMEKIFAIDTENNSLALTDGLKYGENKKFGGFNVANLTEDIGYKPTIYKALQTEAINHGATVVIQDSLSHAWQAKNGVLDLVGNLKESNNRYQRDSYAAWGNPDIMEQKQTLNQIIRNDKAHIISTARAKEKLDYQVDEKGKTVLVSLGEQAILPEGVTFEPDLVLLMLKPGSEKTNPRALIRKSRYGILAVGEEYEFDQNLCSEIAKYLDEGIDPEVLLEERRKEYIENVKAFLDGNKNAVPLWKQLKKDKGYEDTKLDDMPLDVLKELYITLTID